MKGKGVKLDESHSNGIWESDHRALDSSIEDIIHIGGISTRMSYKHRETCQ